MVKVLFVCHGNICRSVMAQFVFQDMVDKAGLSDQFYVDSCATSNEEIGNDMYPPARRKLQAEGVPFVRHSARRITSSDYERFDYIIAMEEYNLRNIARIIPSDPSGKIRLLLDRDIADPWYTGNFDRTYSDLVMGCSSLLDELSGT
ncbi:MAG: low molecular weight phosphotyrosine protein phosphatase [Clostridiales bacterium]|nr:low molecular weight phosphotyrosine protein phosphatase [Clostridiales bacterium]